MSKMHHVLSLSYRLEFHEGFWGNEAAARFTPHFETSRRVVVKPL